MRSRGRGRGSSRGRGRGRGGGGRGAPRGGRASRFHTTRVEDNEVLENEASEDEAASSDSEVSSSEGEDEAEEPNQASRSYLALLNGFADNSERTAKRRKLDSGHATIETPAEALRPELPEEEEGEEQQDEVADVDYVEEAEEDPSNDLEGEDDGAEDLSDDEDMEALDPFDSHFTNVDTDAIGKTVKAIDQGEWESKRLVMDLSRAVLMKPKVDGAEEGDPDLPPPVRSTKELKLKHKLRDIVSRKMQSLDSVQQGFAPALFHYRDMLYGERSLGNAESLRRIVCLHAVNHVLKTRDRVIKNNAKLARDNDADLELRDQGFTRPKVLFILPTRQSCARMMSTIEDLCEPDQRENRKRFEDGYVGPLEEKFRDEKPEDFLELFDGNDDDMFRLGVKFTRKTIKYFSQFYNSDILLASPLGLRMAIGSEEDKKPVDHDFLSSIEIVIVDQANALLQQNWEHVEHIFEHLNLQPKDAHGCDFSRVRSWYLEGWARYFRQTVVLSPFVTPELTELFRTRCHNHAGKIRFQPEHPGVLHRLPVRAKQTFSRFESPSAAADPDARFEYFTSTIVPFLAKRAKDMAGTVIFVPTYLDFVRLRNYFSTAQEAERLSFGSVSEYASASVAARARAHFANGRHKVLLYTERAHHFRRYKLKGARRVVMYGLPDDPTFYGEITGGYLAASERAMKLGPGEGSVRVMFSKYDGLKLERIVGTQRAGKMVREKGDTFDFV